MLVPLTATSTGYVAFSGYPGANTVHVIGSWYAYGDSWGTEMVDGGVGVAGERGNCQLVGGFPTSDCSTITSPLPPAPVVDAGPDAGPPTTAPAGYDNGFPPEGDSGTAAQTFCISGVGAAVIAMDGGTAADYSDIFGIGSGFDFNNMGGDKLPYNATAEKVVGVQFTLSSSGAWPSPRIEFPTPETVAAAQDSYAIFPTKAGTYTVLWATNFAPPAVSGVNLSFTAPDAEPPFDPTMLLSIQVHVPTSTMGTVTVNNLCISNLSAIVTK
jgi:hypothetical protein